MSKSSLSGSVDVVNADHDRWSSSSVGKVVEFSSSVVGRFSHRRVSVGDGLSCAVKCEGDVCVREDEGFSTRAISYGSVCMVCSTQFHNLSTPTLACVVSALGLEYIVKERKVNDFGLNPDTAGPSGE